MSAPEPVASGPVCLFDHGPMQPIDDGRWECILCSFVVLATTGDGPGGSVQRGDDHAA